MEELPVLSKHDIHPLFASRWARAAIVAYIVCIVPPFIDPEFRQMRPGLIDVIGGVLAGMIAGKMLAKNLPKYYYKIFSEAKGSFWAVVFTSKKASLLEGIPIPIAIFGSTLLCGYITWKFGLHWPWGNCPNNMPISMGCFYVAGISLFVSMFRCYAKWYDDLPN